MGVDSHSKPMRNHAAPMSWRVPVAKQLGIGEGRGPENATFCLQRFQRGGILTVP
jgi:hypothetical protein